MVDARDGAAPDDSKILETLRKGSKPFYLVVNKVDGLDPDQAAAEFAGFGVKQLFTIAASQVRVSSSCCLRCWPSLMRRRKSMRSHPAASRLP